jgi:Transposase
MSRIFRKISADVKAKILAELQDPASSAIRIAKKYNISKATIYTWKNQARELTAKTLETPEIPLNSEAKNTCASNFIEVPIIDSSSSSCNHSPNSISITSSVDITSSATTSFSRSSLKPRLEKASLIFNDFSIIFEGTVPTSSLIAIIQILEREPC